MRWFAKKLHARGRWSLACMMALSLIEGHAVGQCDEQKLLASDGAESDQLGYSVSISGAPGSEVAIVGAYLHDDNGLHSGSAYIYRRSGANWVEEAKLLASDGAAGDWFGIFDSISGTPGNEVAIVGAPRHDDNGTDSGSAYIYRFNGVNWVEEAKLIASDGAAGDIFGQSVSISDDVAIVGASRHDDNGTDSGSAYIYRFNPVLPGWVEEQKLLASDAAAGDRFGVSVSIRGFPGNEVAIIGAFDDDDNGTTSGSAYIYRRNGASWVEEAKLLASDGAAFDAFGTSVSIISAPGNEVAIVGALWDDDNGFRSGSAYIYRKSGATWVEEQKLLASDGATYDFFGQSVSISGPPGREVVIVGASQSDFFNPGTGKAYIYRFNGVTWHTEEIKILAADGAAVNHFGWSVSISGDFAIVGAPAHDDNGIESGSAYIFTGLFITALSGDCNSNGINDLNDLFLYKTSADCNSNGIPDECDIVSGVSVDVDVDGIPDECLASCPPDVNTDGNVNVTDLLALLSAWGACP